MARAEAFNTSKPLIGTDEATVDDKGRISITVKKAHRLGEGLMMTLGPRGCLVIYPEAVWEALVREVMSMPVMHPSRDQFTRIVLGAASDTLAFDQQNRIVIPVDLREAAHLDKGDRVKIVGCGDRVEIWKEAKWDRFRLEVKEDDRQAVVDKAYAPIAEHVLATRHDDEQEAQAKESRA